MGCSSVSLLRTFTVLVVITFINFYTTVAQNPITMTKDETSNAVIVFDGLIEEQIDHDIKAIEFCWRGGKNGRMDESAIQTAIECTDRNSRTKKCIKEANALFQNAAENNQLQRTFAQVKIGWRKKTSNTLKLESWKLTAASAVSAIWTNHQNDILQHCWRESTITSGAEKVQTTKSVHEIQNKIVILVAQGAFGGIGLEMVKMLSELGYFVDVVTLPRIKTSLRKHEDDDAWKELLKEIEAVTVNVRIRIVGRFHVGPTVDAVNDKICDIISKSKNKVEFNSKKKKLADELEAALAAEAAVITSELREMAKNGYSFAIESLVPAGFNHPKECKKNYAIRYQLMEVMVDWLNNLKEDSQAQMKPVFLCSIGLPVNSTYEHGRYHVSTDGKKSVTKLKYYVPDILVCVKFPEEAIRALNGLASHQFANTKYMYVTFLKYPDFPTACMADCMKKYADSDRFGSESKALEFFFTKLGIGELNSNTGVNSSNFLKLDWPIPVVRHVAYEPEVVDDTKDRIRDINFNYWETAYSPPSYHQHAIGEDD